MRALALLITLAAGGCMTDANGNSCPWAPGSDGTCPDDSGGGSSGPSYHRYISATGAVVGGDLRVMMTGYDDGGPAYIETVVVPADAPAGEPAVVTVDGEPLRAIVPRIAAIGDVAYLLWGFYGEWTRGAPLAADGTIDGGRVLELEGEYPALRAVGERFAVIVAVDGFVGIEWLDVAGARVAATVVADRGATLAAIGAGDTGLVLALTRDDAAGGRGLSVVRVDPAGVVVDEQEIVRSVAAESWLTGAAVATTADGGALVVYGFQEELDRRIRVARIAADGELIDAPSVLPDVPELVRSGDALIALSSQGENGDAMIYARALDDDGDVIGGPTYTGPAPYGGAEVVPAPDGFALVVETGGAIETGWVSATGAATTPRVVAAEQYELGGCSAGGATGLGMVVLVLAWALTRRAAPGTLAVRDDGCASNG